MTKVDQAPQGSIPIGAGVLAIAVPLAVAGVVYGLWYVSDRLLYIGPLDRATFGWLIVVPLWAATPVATGFAWRRLSSASRSLVATICGLVVGGVATAVLWFAISSPDCQFGAVRSPRDWLDPAIVVGVLIGGGLAIGGLAATRIVAVGRPWSALLVGAVIQLGAGATAILFLYGVMLGGTCQRPLA